MRSTLLLLIGSLLVELALSAPGYGSYSAAPYSSYSSGGSSSSSSSSLSYTSGQEPVRDTPEVARARQEHLAAVARAQALVSGAAPQTPAAPAAPADTPEVVAARARHLAILQDAHAAHAAYAHAPAHLQQPPAALPAALPAPVQDTVEVAAAKAKHLAAVEQARAGATAHHISGAYSGGSAYGLQHQQDTVEVAAAKAQHLAAVEQAAARVSSSSSGGSSSSHAIASQYALADTRHPGFHYPNVPGDLVFARFPAPAPAPIARYSAPVYAAPAPVARYSAPSYAAPAPIAAVRYNTLTSSSDADNGGQYVPDDEGRYYPSQNDEGQYDPSLDAEGQYDPRLNAEGQYVPSLNDEGQYDGRLDAEDNMPYSYSYSDGLSSKTETKTADGLTRGRFSYVDANGVLQAVEYEADNLHGFRASGTNLPQASSAPAAPARLYQPPPPPQAAYQPLAVSSYSLAAPAYRAPVAAYGVPAATAVPAVPAVPVPDVPADTPEVAAAKAAHFAAHREAGARLANAYSG